MYSFIVRVLVLMFLLLVGCAPVQIQEKERLADPIMRFDSDPAADQMFQFLILPREGSIGGFGSIGAGGCSCK